MATSTGIIGFQGTIGGISFYMRKGKLCARKTGGPSKEKIASSKNCQRTRENNAEFKGATAASKFLREGLSCFIKDYADWNISGRLNGVFQRVIARADGIRGERSMEIRPNKNLLIGFNLNKEIAFDSIFQAPYTTAVNSARTEAILTIPKFDASKCINAPGGATHFRLVNAITVVPKFVYDPGVKQYFRNNDIVEIMKGHEYSDYTSISGNTGSDIVIAASLANSPIIDPESGLVSVIGIDFYQKEDGVYYPLATNNCMKIYEIF